MIRNLAQDLGFWKALPVGSEDEVLEISVGKSLLLVLREPHTQWEDGEGLTSSLPSIACDLFYEEIQIEWDLSNAIVLLAGETIEKDPAHQQ